MTLSLVSVDGTEPISTSDAKDHLRVDLSDDDVLISAAATAARDYFEADTNRQLVKATYTLTLDDFPRSRHEPIRIPRPPLRSVTSITYLDSDGTEQTWSSSEYTVETFDGPGAQPGRVYPKAEYVWPTTQDVPGAVTITFEAGYDVVPEGMKATLLLLVGDLYANREAQVVGNVFSDNRTAQRLLGRYRLPAYA